MEKSPISGAKDFVSSVSSRVSSNADKAAVMGTAFLPVEVPWNSRVQAVIVITGIVGIGLVNKYILNPMLDRTRRDSEKGNVK